jgi:putative DNA primase/helicase
MTSLHDVAHQMRLVLPDDPPPDLQPDGKRRYFGRKKKSWYRLRELRTYSGNTVVVGSFGNYSASKGGFWKVDVDWKGIGDEEREQLVRQRAAASAAADAQRRRNNELAALTGLELWRTAARTGHSTYLARKFVDAEACRFLGDGSIVIPLLRYDWPRDQALVGTQRIWPDGKKRFTNGLAKKGASLRLGLVQVGEPILVCEGYATGLTLRMAVQRRLPVVVALDAYNLLPVCELLRGLHPGVRLLLCADDDWKTEGNPGRDKAKAVTKALDRCEMVWPSFAGLARADKETDFNDLHVRAGLRRVHAQLRAALDASRRFRHAA